MSQEYKDASAGPYVLFKYSQVIAAVSTELQNHRI